MQGRVQKRIWCPGSHKTGGSLEAIGLWWTTGMQTQSPMRRLAQGHSARTGSDPKWPDSKSLCLVNSQVAANGVEGTGRWRLAASVLKRLREAGCHLGDQALTRRPARQSLSGDPPREGRGGQLPHRRLREALLTCLPARPTGAAAPRARARRGQSCGWGRVCTAPGALSLRSCGCVRPLDPLVAEVL